MPWLTGHCSGRLRRPLNFNVRHAMASQPLSILRVVAAFCVWGPVPAAVFLFVIGLYATGPTGVIAWLLVSLFFTYAAGLIPAAVTGAVYAMIESARRQPYRPPLLGVVTGSVVGLVVGALSGFVVFDTSPNLIQPTPLTQRLLSNLGILAVPGFFGGALASARVSCLTRRSSGPLRGR